LFKPPTAVMRTSCVPDHYYTSSVLLAAAGAGRASWGEREEWRWG